MKVRTIQMKKQSFFSWLVILGFLGLSAVAKGQETGNTDEAKVGRYTLPPLLQTDDGKLIKTPLEWEILQRPRILQLFEQNVYGRYPDELNDIHYKTIGVANALNGKAVRKEVTIFFTSGDSGPSMTVLLYLPKRAKEKVPVFVGLNFQGNHTIQKDTGITVTEHWKSLHPAVLFFERGQQEKRWPVEEVIAAGYGVATAWYEDLEPDQPEGWRTGIRTSLQQELNIKPEEWGAIGAWAWGLSRMMDYLETDTQVLATQVVLTGHSRLGKAALWAGANDKRFAIVVSNNSGEGGAALARRNFGETVDRINASFPHWFIEKYKSYNGAVDKLPVDQHMLLALIAPRPLYVASAVEDTWADPKGEFLSAKEAGKVYALYGLKGIEQEEQPAVNTPVGNVVRYHVRTGKHDMLIYDWKQYISFANKFFSRQSH